jgi:hypothetical protein
MCACAATAAATCPMARRRSDGCAMTFVWTKMGVESGEDLNQILARKEKERKLGKGVFWWGIGSSLGASVREQARAQGGRLPVLFSTMLSRPKDADASPTVIWQWTRWEGEDGSLRDIPSHVKVISRGDPSKGKHYALVCYSNEPLNLGSAQHRFDPTQYLTFSGGKKPGSSQVTALLRDTPHEHNVGPYAISLRATLIEPWNPKLACPILINPK